MHLGHDLTGVSGGNPAILVVPAAGIDEVGDGAVLLPAPIVGIVPLPERLGNGRSVGPGPFSFVTLERKGIFSRDC